MSDMDIKQEKEAGWEFTLPQYVMNPFNWFLVVLIIIALILSFNLIIKIVNQQNGVQTSTTQSP